MKPQMGGISAPVPVHAGTKQVKSSAAKVFLRDVLNTPREHSNGGAMNTTPSPNGFDSRLSLREVMMIAYGPETEFKARKKPLVPLAD